MIINKLKKEFLEKKRKCSVCGEVKDWIFSHSTANGSRHFKDKTGRLWEASKCSECTGKYHKKKNKRTRSIKRWNEKYGNRV